MGLVSWFTHHADQAAVTGARKAALTTPRHRTLTPAGVAMLEAIAADGGGHSPGCHAVHAPCLARRILEETR